jgi:D-inositol-3-phosphate glycosyltransferase
MPAVLYSFPHPLGGPGINNTAWQQVNALAELGVPTTVYCTSLRTPLPAQVTVIETLVLARQRIPHRAIGLQRAYTYHDLRVAYAIKSSAGRFDVVHCWPRACLHTIASARRRQVRSLRELPNAHTAQTFRDAAAAGASIGVELPRGASHRFDARRLRMENSEFELADYLLAPSEYVARSFVAAGIADAKLLRHQYGFDPAMFPAPELLRPDRLFTAAFVGRGEPAKGLHVALEAWLASGVAERGRFIVLGHILESYREAMAHLLRHDSVELPGFVSDVGAILRQVDVLVFPTFTEGSALVTYEAMASGAVPLTSTAAGAPVVDGVDGLLHDPGDVATIASQLRDLDADRDRLARLRLAALSRRGDLTWRAAAERTLDAYRHTLGWTAG